MDTTSLFTRITPWEQDNPQDQYNHVIKRQSLNPYKSMVYLTKNKQPTTITRITQQQQSVNRLSRHKTVHQLSNQENKKIEAIGSCIGKPKNNGGHTMNRLLGIIEDFNQADAIMNSLVQKKTQNNNPNKYYGGISRKKTHPSNISAELYSTKQRDESSLKPKMSLKTLQLLGKAPNKITQRNSTTRYTSSTLKRKYQSVNRQKINNQEMVGHIIERLHNMC